MTLFTKALASLDLRDEKQKAIRVFIETTHESLCIWRALTAHRSEGQLLEVVEFVSSKRATTALPWFAVVTWDLVTAAVRWQKRTLTRGQAIRRFTALKDGLAVDPADEIEIRINMRGRLQG